MNQRSLSLLETYYKKFMNNIANWSSERVVNVDMKLLNDMDIMIDHHEIEDELPFTRNFQLVETDEKITLINDQFIIWIVPEKNQGIVATHILIALNSPPTPRPEMIIIIQGNFNTSKLVLRVLEKYLMEIQENEELMMRLNNAKKD